MSWNLPADYYSSTATGAWLNPWPHKLLIPSMKNVRLNWPIGSWQVEVNAYNEKRGQLPVPPPGIEVGWWLLPKTQWPILTPWSRKVFGSWPPSKVTMAEDLQKTPPFGFIKLGVPGEPAAKHHQISFHKMKMNMNEYINYISPHLKIVVRNTPMGQKHFYVNANWEEKDYQYQQWRSMFRQHKYEEIMAMIPYQKKKLRPSTNLFTGEPQNESVDLFS